MARGQFFEPFEVVGQVPGQVVVDAQGIVFPGGGNYR